MLITGPIWARPVWGVWWTWDARLTTTLILWMIYVGYLMLRAYMTEPGQRARFAAVMGIIGFLNVPIVHMSVEWWRTLHPKPVVMRSGGLQDLPDSMHVALWSTLLAFMLLFACVLYGSARRSSVSAHEWKRRAPRGRGHDGLRGGGVHCRIGRFCALLVDSQGANG